MEMKLHKFLFLALGLVLAFTALLLVIWAPAGSESAQADTSAPEMHFIVSGTGVTCDAGATDGDPWDGTTAPKCTVPSGGSFTLTIEGDDGADPNAAFGMATIVDLDGLNFTPDPADIGYEPCGIGAAASDAAGNIGHSCSRFFTGAWDNEPAIVTMAGVQCKTDGASKVVLGAELQTSPSPTGGAKFFADVGSILLKRSGSQAWNQPDGAVINVPVADVVTINCGEVVVDTPTPTVTDTPAGPTATATATSEGPTPTVTETPAGPTDTPVPATSTPTNTPPAVQKGDVNGDGEVNSIDALWVLWFVAEITDSVPVPGAADADQDGDVDALDALYILWAELDLVEL